MTTNPCAQLTVSSIFEFMIPFEKRDRLSNTGKRESAAKESQEMFLPPLESSATGTRHQRNQPFEQTQMRRPNNTSQRKSVHDGEKRKKERGKREREKNAIRV